MNFLNKILCRERNRILDHYHDMRLKYLGDSANRVPREYHSQFICLGGASEITHQMSTFIPKSAEKILIIGIFGGRDYFYFKERGHTIYALDLFEDERFEQLTVGDVQKPLPFEDSFFDAVIMTEVIEHLCFDYQALLNIRKVLKQDGLLLLTAPFLHDYQETHIRIHNRISVTRLLQGAGFEIKKIIERPNLFFAPAFFNALHHAINLIFFLTTHKTLYSVSLPFFWKLEKTLGEKKISIRKFSKRWGALFVCKKSANFRNYTMLNIKEYQPSK